MALMADDGYARAISPSHTNGDGDTVFSLATGRWNGDADITMIGALAADAMAEGDRPRGHARRPALPGIPAARDLKKCASDTSHRAMNLHLALLLGYSARSSALGLWIGRRVRARRDFFVAGRQLGPGLIFSTMLAANIGAGSTVGATGLGYRDGVAAWWWVGSAAIGSLVLAFWIGPAMRRSRRRTTSAPSATTSSSATARRPRGIVALLLWIGSLAILAGQLIAIALRSSTSSPAAEGGRLRHRRRR